MIGLYTKIFIQRHDYKWFKKIRGFGLRTPYRGWCSLYKPKACDQNEPGYTGDLYWAICDAAPCTETENPSDPDRPLRCQCRVEDTPFVGTKNSCTGDNDGIISAMPLWVWDFENNTWRIPVPGYEYVQGACAPLKSDPLPPR